jgi:hypothetical protein
MKANELQNNMAELRGLMLLLDDGQWFVSFSFFCWLKFMKRK